MVWTESTDAWDCGAQTGGGGGGGSFQVQLEDVTITSTTTVIDFSDSYFTVTESPSFEANITAVILSDTATALAADPADCAANTFADAIAASGALTCNGVVDADVSDTITVGNAGTVDSDALGCDVGDDNLISEDCFGDVLDEGEIEDIYLLIAGDTSTGAYNFGGSSGFELPNAAAPTTDATGEIALDTTVTDHQPLYQYFDGTNNMTMIAVDTSQLPATDNEIIKYDAATDAFVFEADATGAGGSAIVFDIGDDGGDDSTDVSEIATTGDTNSIFTESAADKILIALANNWPSADTADALDADPSDCAANQFADAIAANGDLTCNGVVDADVADALTIAGGTIGTSAITLVQGTAPTPTSEGVIEWETDDDHIIVGDGSAAVEFVPAEDISGDATMTDAGVIEVTEADALESDPSDCAAGTKADSIVANGDLTCSAVDSADITVDTIVAADIATDAINTGELDDGADSPSAGECLVVASATTDIEYVACEAITAGDHLTRTADDIDLDIEVVTDTKGLWFELPTAADDFESIWSPNGFNVTLVKLWCESDQTVTLMLQVDDGTPADVDTVDLICISTPDDDDALNGDVDIDDGETLDLTVISVSGTPTWVSIMWTFTIDDA